MTDKVKPILPTGSLSTTGSRRRSGLIAIPKDQCMPVADGVPRVYENKTQLPEQKALVRHGNNTSSNIESLQRVVLF